MGVCKELPRVGQRLASCSILISYVLMFLLIPHVMNQKRRYLVMEKMRRSRGRLQRSGHTVCCCEVSWQKRQLKPFIMLEKVIGKERRKGRYGEENLGWN